MGFNTKPADKIALLQRIDLDPYIRDNVIEINKAGIETFFCCSGLWEDHPKFDLNDPRYIGPKDLYATAHLCVSLESLIPYMADFCNRLRGEVVYFPEDTYSGKALEGFYNGYSDTGHSRAKIRQMTALEMWRGEMTSLLGRDSNEFDRPCISIRPVQNINGNSKKAADWHMKLRWDKLFEMLLSLKDS